MLRLKDRNRPVPGGAPFHDKHTRYQSSRYASFNTTVSGVIQARMANPGVTRSNNLPTDRHAVEAEVDYAWANFCWAKKYTDFIEGEPEQRGPVQQRPFQNRSQHPIPSLGQGLKNVAAGVETILSWIKSKEEAAPQEQAEKRAAVCVACPLNLKEDWKSTFTVAAANAIQMALQARTAWNLSTSKDEELGLCGACGCVNRLSVHCPVGLKLEHMTDEAHAALDPNCWVLSEEESSNK